MLETVTIAEVRQQLEGIQKDFVHPIHVLYNGDQWCRITLESMQDFMITTNTTKVYFERIVRKIYQINQTIK